MSDMKAGMKVGLKARLNARRGSALVLVLLMTLAVAGLAAAAIFMASSAGLLSRFYDRERTYRLAAESGLELVRARLMSDASLVIPDTGMVQVLAGEAILDAAGTEVRNVRVNVFAATTGDTTPSAIPRLTLVAQAYDAAGTRVVRRQDLTRESFAHFSLFADSFPSGAYQRVGTVPGRVHTNGTWRSQGATTVYRDTVSAVAGITGDGTHDVDSVPAAARIPYPVAASLDQLDTIAVAGNLSFAPRTAGNQRTRLEFVAFDADNDGTIEAQEGFARVFDLASATGIDDRRLRGAPTVWSGALGVDYYRWDDPIIQKQCGANYYRSGRWHFFTVEAHRAVWARSVIVGWGSGNFPDVRDNPAGMRIMDDYSYDGAYMILTQPTARCYPVGSPQLMTSERFTNTSGTITGTAADTVPFGVLLAAGNRYGGNDTTFTPRVRSCTRYGDPLSEARSGHCIHTDLADSVPEIGTWRAFGGTAVSGISTNVRQGGELPYLWPYSTTYNSASRGVISATAGPLYVSGTVRGRVSLRAAGEVSIIGGLRYQGDPDDPSRTPCEDSFGLMAVGDVLITDGLLTRVRRIADPANINNQETVLLSGDTRLSLHGSFMSVSGTVGAENPGTRLGVENAQLNCPDDGDDALRSNGGCLAVTGGLMMRRFTVNSALHTDANNSGFHYLGNLDRCQSSLSRPPFFPLTNRVRVERTIEVEPSQANTPAKVRTLLLRLKGRAL